MKESIHARSSKISDWCWRLADRFVRSGSQNVFSKCRQTLGFAARKKPDETLYIYLADWNNYQSSDYEGKWRVSLGPDQPIAPPPPTWREYLRSRGYRLETDDDIARACAQSGDLTLEELDRPLDAFGWEDLWDNFTGPEAKAFHLLKKLDFGPAESKLRQAGEIIFEEFGGRPGFNYTWVELKDDLTVSLLQARLIELNLPINVKIAASWGAVLDRVELKDDLTISLLQARLIELNLAINVKIAGLLRDAA
jgi:hypothetical protein